MVSQPQKNSAPYDDKMSLLDIIKFFKANFKKIFLFTILGGFLGFLYQKSVTVEYTGQVLISPGIVAGKYIENSSIIVTKLNSNSFYSKETFLICNPSFNKNTDIDYKMSNIVRPFLKSDGVLIELKMNGSNKETIHSCFENITNDINANQKKIADSLIKSKKDELISIVEQLNYLNNLKKMNDKAIKNLKKNESTELTEPFYEIIFNKYLSLGITIALMKLKDIENDLSSEHTKEAEKILPIDIKPNIFTSLKFFMVLGLIIGASLGILMSFSKKYIKVR
jgi:hypothetical protein